MSRLIALDDGHGFYDTPGKRTPYIKSLGRSIRENEFNKPVVNFLKEELERCGFKTLLVAPTDADTPLQTRTDLANSKGADAYISIHFNAYDGKFDDYDPEGVSLYIYPGHANKAAGKLANSIAKHLKGGTKQKWRGIKENDFHVLRETNMIAVLSENGFMDNEREALLMLDKDFQREVAVEHAKGICDYFGVKYKAPAPSKSSADTPKLGATFHVKKETDGYYTAANAKVGKDPRTKVKAGIYHVFNTTKDGMINITSKNGVPGAWINPADNKAEQKPAPKPKTFLIRVNASELWYYDKPDWDAKKDTVKRGDVFTVVDTLYVNGSKMYKLKSGTYITANTDYVEKV